MILAILTALTMVAFAANSLLCRVALLGGFIDPVSFTTLRLVSGALALILLSRWFGEKTDRKYQGSWGAAAALFAYAAAFSLAYVSLNMGIGTLILFGAVQVTMIGAALKAGERLGPWQWLGAAAVFGGLVYLVFPGITAPNPWGAALMCLSGTAWGIYSLRGKGAPTPIAMTTGNFTRAAPMALLASLAAISTAHLTPWGIGLAVISGSVTSGLGYVLWYRALRGLTTTNASVVQGLVPVISALGGVVILSEPMSLRLVVASVLIIGGVAVAIKRAPKPDQTGAG